MNPNPAAAETSLNTDRSSSWRWLVCGLLLLATLVNYMDRLTANTLAVEIKREFSLDNEQYGHLELGFGLAFAVGSISFGFLVDRFGVYWLYPFALVGWSLMGFLTGLSQSYEELLLFRILLGLFEAGHWPCGLKTVQILLAPRDRAMGNSLMQSGTALGSILAPQVIKSLLTEDPASWRMPFLVIGAGGSAWVILWFLFLRPRDLAPRTIEGGATRATEPRASLMQVLLSKRYLALAVLVVCINMNWHLFRVWLPIFLREARGYERDAMLNLTTYYYVAADIGVLAAGAATSWLSRKGLSVFASRVWVYAGCCVLTTATTLAIFMPVGPLLVGALLLVAFGGLGSFSAYYSLTQDLSLEHQGKVSGSLGTLAWVTGAIFHPIFGAYLDRTHNYELVFGSVGWLPFLGLLAILLLWQARPERK